MNACNSSSYHVINKYRHSQNNIKKNLSTQTTGNTISPCMLNTSKHTIIPMHIKHLQNTISPYMLNTSKNTMSPCMLLKQQQKQNKNMLMINTIEMHAFYSQQVSIHKYTYVISSPQSIYCLLLFSYPNMLHAMYGLKT